MTGDIVAQEEQLQKILSAMNADLDRRASGVEIDFRKYENQIREAGEVAFFAELFRRFEGSSLNRYLFALGFAWQEMSIDAWRKILRNISSDEPAIYQYVWFTSQYLAIDVLGMIESDSAVDETAREFVRVHFPTGAPRGGDFERELMNDIGVDAPAMWRRLEREGAPMKIRPSERP